MESRVSSPAIFAWMASAVCACSASVEPEFTGGSRVQPIVLGAPTDRHEAVVHLRIRTDGGHVFNCAGSLVAPDVVLTAAHCLPKHFWIDDTPRAVQAIDVFFGSDVTQPQAEAGLPAWREAASWQQNLAAPPRDQLPGMELDPYPETAVKPGPPVFGLEPYVGRYDTGIVVLREPAPASVRPLPMSLELPSEEQLQTLPARIVGFGATEVREGTLVGTGIKREGTPVGLRVVPLSEDDAELQLYGGTLEIEAAGGAGANAAGCKEDSGGPLLMQLTPDEWTVIAVTSWGEPRCDGVVHYAPLSESRAFLQEHF